MMALQLDSHCSTRRPHAVNPIPARKDPAFVPKDTQAVAAKGWGEEGERRLLRGYRLPFGVTRSWEPVRGGRAAPGMLRTPCNPRFWVVGFPTGSRGRRVHSTSQHLLSSGLLLKALPMSPCQPEAPGFSLRCRTGMPRLPGRGRPDSQPHPAQDGGLRPMPGSWDRESFLLPWQDISAGVPRDWVETLVHRHPYQSPLPLWCPQALHGVQHIVPAQ